MELNFLPVSRKLSLLKQAETSGTVKATARAHKVQPDQIRHWRNGISKLIEKKAENCKAQTVHSGDTALIPELENQVFEWIPNNTNEFLLYL